MRTNPGRKARRYNRFGHRQPTRMSEYARHRQAERDRFDGMLCHIGVRIDAEIVEDDETFDGDDPRWYFCPCQGSSGAWQDMSDFVDERVTDPALAARLREDLTGKGAFRRFARTLRRHEELMHEWLRMKDDRAVARAGEWLAQEGLLADPTVPPTAPPRVE